MADAAPLSVRAVRALVVDDDAGARDGVRRHLQAQQFHIVEAGVAGKARAIRRRADP